jgi:hemerythrin superfamily protein
MEAFEEHSIAELGLTRLLATDPEDPSFAARVTTCKEIIEHHVEEEEEELFPKVEKSQRHMMAAASPFGPSATTTVS